MRSVTISLFLLVLGTCISAQNILVLEKDNKRRNIKFRAGDRINMHVAPYNAQITGRIINISDSLIYLENTINGIALKNITEVHTKR